MKIQLVVHIVCVLAVSLIGTVSCCTDDDVCCSENYPPEGAAVGNRSYCSTCCGWCRAGYEFVEIRDKNMYSPICGNMCCVEYTKTSDTDNCIRDHELCLNEDSVCCKAGQKCFSYEGEAKYCAG